MTVAAAMLLLSRIPLATYAAGGAGDSVVQTSDNGDTRFAGAYTVNPAGFIGGEPDWSQWVEVAGLPASRYEMCVAVVSNRIYWVSGANSYGVSKTNVYCSDGTSWTEVPGLPAGRLGAVAGEVNGSLIVTGGGASHSTVGCTNTYRFTGAGWEEVAWLPKAIGDSAGATYAGAFYVIGGNVTSGATTNVYRFDGTSWAEVAGLPAPRNDMGAVACGGYLYAVGGLDSRSGGNSCTNVYRYDGTNWTEVAGLPAPRADSGVAARNGSLFVVGGYATEEDEMFGLRSVPKNNVYRYDGTAWTEMAELPLASYKVLLANLDSGLYAFDGSRMTTNVYRYPATLGSSGVEPASGARIGGYEVVIRGTNLCDGTLGDVTNVTLCGVAATVTGVFGSTQIVVTAGAATALGVGDVRVFSASFGETVKSQVFTYAGAGIEISGPAFGPVASGAVVTNLFTVTNSGNEALVISAATTDGAGATMFDVTGFNGLTVAPGTASTVPVVFRASAAGMFTPTCHVANNSPAPNFSFGLSGAVVELSATVGPYAGGNTITITNVPFGTITNVLVGGVAATLQGSGPGWVTIVLPATGAAGVKDIVIQTADQGDITLPAAYTVSPAGEIWDNGLKRGGPYLSAGFGYHSLGLKADGSIEAWGANTVGQTTVPFPNANFAAVSAGWNCSFGLKSDGTISAWGDNNMGQALVPFPNAGFVAVSGGGFHTLGLKSDGSVVAWGYNGRGQTAVPPPNADFVAVSAGLEHSLGLRSDGSVVAWGSDVYHQTEVPVPNTGFVAVSAGGFHSLGLKADGSVVAWGYNDFRQTEVPAPNADFVAVSAGLYHSLGLKSDGTIVQWGYIWGPVPVPNVGFVAVAAGREHSLALKEDGSIVAWGADYSGETVVPAPNVDFGMFAYGVAPKAGLWTGGYPVAISGTNLCNGALADVTRVTLCGVEAAVLGVSASTQIVVAAGVGTPGVGDVRVCSASHGETVKAGAFEYLRVPQAPLAFAPASPQAYGTTNSLRASGGSGTGAVSYAVLDGPGAIVDGTNLAVTAGSGAVRVCATKAGDALYLPVAVTSAVAAVQGGQVIDFPPVADQLATNVVALGASASSGLAVTFSVAGWPASIDGNVLRFTGAGTVSVVASQPGDANWSAAPEKTNSFAVAKAGATVALTNLLQTYDGTPRAVTAATVPEGLAVSVLYGDRQSMSVGGSGAAPVLAGSYAVSGTVVDDFYSGRATGTLVVAKADQAIDFPPVAGQLATNVVALGANASSGLDVTFSVAGGPASIDGNDLRFTGAGTVSVVASQPGDANWSAAPEKTNSFAVAKAGATVALSDLLQTYDGTPRTVTAATVPEGLAVSVLYGDRQSMSVGGSGVAPVLAGSYAVSGTVVDDFYSGRSTGTLVVAKADQVIDFPPVAPQAVTSAVALAATGGASGTPVMFSVVSGPGVIDGAGLSFSAAGEVAVVASQAGTENYNAAPDVTNVVSVVGVVISVMPQHGVQAGCDKVRIDGLWLGDGTNITSVTLCGVEATIVSQAIHSVWVLSGATNITEDLTGPVHVVSGFGDAALEEAFTYHVLAPPAALPATQISSAAFKTHWALVPEVDHYVIDVSTTSNFTDFVAGYSNQFVGATDNAWVSGLADGTWYWYRLRACTSNDVQSLNSNVIGVPTGGTVPWVTVSNMTGTASGGGVQEFRLSLIFAGAGLAFSATSDAPAVVTAQIDAGTGVLRLTYPGAPGTAMVTVAAKHLETGYEVSYSFAVTIIGAPAYGVGPLKSSSLEVYQTVTVTNTANVAAEGVLVTVAGLDDPATVLNRTSVNGRGEAVIEYPHSLAPGESAAIKVVYARAYGAQVLQGRPATVEAHLVLSPLREAPPSEAVASAVVGAWRRADGGMVIAFRTVPGAEYMIQYRDSMSEAWKNVYPAVTASGTVTYWVDSGQPVTEAHPKDVPTRFYQILSYPNN